MVATKSGQSAHKAGPLKQQNKSHKTGRHRSNRALDSVNKGRRDVKSISKKCRRDMKKQDRRNQATQLRKNKRDEALAIKRQLGGHSTPPILVTLISLNATNDPWEILESIKTCDEDAVCTTTSKSNLIHISFPRYKQRLSFLIPTPGDLYSALDAAKISDTLLFLHMVPDLEVDDDDDDETNFEGNKPKDVLLSALMAHGLPSSVHVIQGMEFVAVKKKAELKKRLLKNLEKRFPNGKLNCLEKSQDTLLLIHQIISQKKQPITMRDRRPHMLAESVEYELNENGSDGTLKVTGYIRGQPLSVNGLVHISGSGTFQLLQIDAPNDSHPLVIQKREAVKNTDMEEGIRVLEHCNPSQQESLVSENVPDHMEGEQTWPTDEEIADAQEEKKKVVKVPKGTSTYQAAWIVESDSDGEESNDDEDEIEMDQCSIHSELSEEKSEGNDSGNEDEDDVISNVESVIEKYDQHMDMDDDNEMYHKFQEERLNEMFPDEIDTPIDRPARQRFARYRGLKSFNTTPWDPKENLPADYAKIFQFENFRRTKKRVLSEERDGVLQGWYVTLHIANVPKEILEKLANDVEAPLVIYGLLPHEQKMSVVNVALKRHPQCLGPIKSKEELIVHIGFERYNVCPIFSAHTNGDKHKYERFLKPDEPVVASFFAPLVFPPAPVIVFKQNSDGSQTLVATGSVLSVDPDRIVVKRVVLSGHPFKINKRSVVVRYMFFMREDIVWFKPIELRTKHGRRGHIQEPLGTHGHMKCIFDSQLKSQDTVMMNLYKRVFPKWKLDCNVPAPKNLFMPGT